jgi:hypothetical protein
MTAPRPRPAAESTVEALMYSLRPGAAALARKDVQGRLRELDERQVRHACSVLQNRDRKIGQLWSDDDVARLVITWSEPP